MRHLALLKQGVYMSSPLLPCPFSYGDLPQGGAIMPMIIASRDPTAQDINYLSGYLWLSDLSQGGTGNLFVQEGFTAGVPNWVALSVTSGAASFTNGTFSGTLTVGGLTTLNGGETVLGTTNINNSGAGVTTIGTGGTGATNIGNATGNTAVTGNLTVSGNVTLSGATSKLNVSVATPATASAGTSAALNSGAIVVSTTAITANSLVFFTTNTLGTVTSPQSYRVSARTPGVSFTIESQSATDTSTVNYWIIN